MTEIGPNPKTNDAPGGLLALIVDDEPTLLDIYSTALRTAGLRTITATDGIEALSFAIERQPAVIILDVIMPLKDGYDTLRDLKANPKTRTIPVIMLSNLGQEFERKRGLDLGAECFLVKAEVGPSAIVSQVRHLVGLDAANA